MTSNRSRHLGPLTHSVNGRPLGRPRTNPTADTAARIEELAAAGCGKNGIAVALNISHHVLGRWLDERDDLLQAYLRGREAERKALHNKLYRTAIEGEGRDALIAAIFLLKSRHGYLEGHEADAGAARLNVTFSIPGSVPLSKYVIENEKPASD